MEEHPDGRSVEVTSKAGASFEVEDPGGRRNPNDAVGALPHPENGNAISARAPSGQPTVGGSYRNKVDATEGSGLPVREEHEGGNASPESVIHSQGLCAAG